jgi:hypothetical protein
LKAERYSAKSDSVIIRRAQLIDISGVDELTKDVSLSRRKKNSSRDFAAANVKTRSARRRDKPHDLDVVEGTAGRVQVARVGDIKIERYGIEDRITRSAVGRLVTASKTIVRGEEKEQNRPSYNYHPNT